MSSRNFKKPDRLWLLLDVDNGQFPVKNYTWWFPTRKAAREHLAEQRGNPKYAKLVGPFKYVLASEK